MPTMPKAVFTERPAVWRTSVLGHDGKGALMVVYLLLLIILLPLARGHWDLCAGRLRHSWSLVGRVLFRADFG